ncbi:MAG: UDP-N-acetylglucosamine 2-epimerase (non-hydrolyzing), partial [Gemmatimonadaceae bacterium]|nr:UDP-N-acetylglucosamine 2-epimerase (non-hydrolyzing) [Gemmatimonadaceae bacterium]
IHGGGHGEMTGRMLVAIEAVLLRHRPNLVVVYGDTNSTLAGALAAAKLHVPVCHVEAGLRSFNRRMPEEVNRVLTDHLSEVLCAPTVQAVANLEREGIGGDRVVNVGDVMFDVALAQGARADERMTEVLDALTLEPSGYVLATVHRAENTDDAQRLGHISDALVEVAKRMPVLWPLHPRTRARLEEIGRDVRQLPGVLVVEPLGYLDMVVLERHAALIVTDSGGVQKEAFFHQVPCVTLREETEWVESVLLGWNRLAPPTSAPAIRDVILAAIGSKGTTGTPYGEGRAAWRIVETMQRAGIAE